MRDTAPSILKMKILILIFSGSVCFINAQYFQYGFQGGFLKKETIYMKAPAFGDNGLMFDGWQIKVPDTLQNQKGTMPFSIEGYLHYCFLQKNYFGFNYRYSHQISNEQGNKHGTYDYYPEVKVNSHWYSFTAGRIFPLGRFNFILEGGLGYAYNKFKMNLDIYNAYGQEYYKVYMNYMNRKNGRLTAYVKPMVDFYSLQVGMRFDFFPDSKISSGAIGKLKVTPSLNVGYNFRTCVTGVKKIRSRVFNPSSEEALAKINDLRFGKYLILYGVSLSALHFETNGQPVLTPYYYPTSNYLEFVPKEKCNGWGSNLFFAAKVAPFSGRKFTVSGGFSFSLGSKGIRGVLAEKREYEIFNNSPVVKETTHDAPFNVIQFEFSGGAGYRVRIASKSYLDFSAVCSSNIFGNSSNMSVALSKYYKFKPGLLMLGPSVDLRIKHIGIGFSVKRSVGPVDRFDHIKNSMMLYTLSFSKDVHFRY